jgi:uncharacterized repeat protein (TIGR01451 family)
VVSNATLSNNNKTITWVITNIPKGATAVITVLARATEFGTQLNNFTIVYPDGHNDTVNCTIEVEGVDLAVVKTVDNATHFVNDTVVWTITVSNADNATTATNVVLDDLLPAGFTFINSTAGSAYDSVSGVWTIGTMAPGASATLTIVSRAPTTNGTFTNEANVTCTEPEWNYDNNYDNATVTIALLPPPVKLVNDTKPFYHENVTYNLTIDNNQVSIPIEIRILNSDEIETELKINAAFFKEALGGFIVTSIDDENSFIDGEKWKEKLDLMCCLPNKFPLPIFLIVNKFDLVNFDNPEKPFQDKNKIDQYFLENQFFDKSFLAVGGNIEKKDYINEPNYPLDGMIKTIMNFKDIKDEFVKPVGNQNVIKNQKKDDKCFIF